MKCRCCARNCRPGAPNHHVTGRLRNEHDREDGSKVMIGKPGDLPSRRSSGGRDQPNGSGRSLSEEATARPVSGAFILADFGGPLSI